MKQSICAPAVPTANLAINKSRIKLYDKQNTIPTYYLEKDSEFMIELFNPTSDVVLAKITINGSPISQGGLVLRPGDRVFLDRYLDVAKKFKFDTYSVNNTEEVKKAIEENGDLKVEFYREQKLTNGWLTLTNLNHTGSGNYNQGQWNTRTGTPIDFLRGDTSSGIPARAGFAGASSEGVSTFTVGDSTTLNQSNASYTTTISGTLGLATMDLMDNSLSRSTSDEPTQAPNRIRTKAKKSKSIETGRVEMGSESNQKFTYVNKSFEYFAFHTVEYKLLPTSRKVNTSEDINVKRYCTNCGSKQKPANKFCPSCGSKQ